MSNLIFPALPGQSIQLTRTPVWNTVVHEASSGRELRGSWWSYPRTRYQLAFNVVRSAAGLAEFQQLVQFVQQHRGKWDSFLYKDTEDGSVTLERFGVGDGVTTQFQLQRSMGTTTTDRLGTWPVYRNPRTNYVKYSNDFTQTGTWVPGGAVTPTGSQWAPDGTQTACALQEDSSTGSHLYTQTLAALVATSAAITVSVYLRAFSRSQAQINFFDHASGSNGAVFDLGLGTVVSTYGAATSASIVAVGNGWYRCSFNANTATGATTPAVAIYSVVSGSTSYTGTSQFTLLAWGAQIETAQSFIDPRTSATLGTTPSRPISTANATAQEVPGYLGSTSARNDGFEPIYDIDSGVLIYSNFVQQSPSAYTLSANGAQITFNTAPAAGYELTWSGNYWRRVRFDMDQLDFDRFGMGYHEVKRLSMITVKA